MNMLHWTTLNMHLLAVGLSSRFSDYSTVCIVFTCIVFTCVVFTCVVFTSVVFTCVAFTAHCLP